MSTAKRNKIPPLSSFTLMHAWMTSTLAETCSICPRSNTSACNNCQLNRLQSTMKRVNTRLQIQAQGGTTNQESDAVLIADALVRLCMRPFIHADIPEFKQLTAKKALRALVNEGHLCYRDGKIALTRKGIRYAIMNCSDFKADYRPTSKEKA